MEEEDEQEQNLLSSGKFFVCTAFDSQTIPFRFTASVMDQILVQVRVCNVVHDGDELPLLAISRDDLRYTQDALFALLHAGNGIWTANT